MKRRRSNTLVALSSAAVLTVYAAGFMRTRAAAERLEHASRERPPVLPSPVVVAAPPVVSAPAPELVSAPAADVVAAVPAPKLPKQPAIAKPVAVAPVTEPAVPAPTATVAPPTAEVIAPPVVAAVAVPHDAPPVSPSAEILLGGIELHNGTFLGWGTSRHGDIQASVTVYSGRITAVSIAQCRTRYSCDVIAHLPGKVLNDQTPEKINNVSGATQSVDAFYWAVIDALKKAK